MCSQHPRKKHSDDATRPPQYTASLAIVDILHAARGRWIEILASAGIDTSLLDGRGHPCPKCGGRDRFSAFKDINDRGAVYCRHCFNRGTDPFPGGGLSTLMWLFGCNLPAAVDWLTDHLGLDGRVADQPRKVTVTRHIKSMSLTPPVNDYVDNLALHYYQSMGADRLDEIAKQMVLPTDVLSRMSVGYDCEKSATTWPMVDVGGSVIGIRMRSVRTGRKWSIKGGRAGLFIPDGQHDNPERLYVAEGPTDTAAVLSVGLSVIGRASCGGNGVMERVTVRRIRPAECVIIADPDDAGRHGAMLLATGLVTCCRTVRIIEPPEGYGDVREWIAYGATADDITAAADAAESLTLKIKSGVKK